MALTTGLEPAYRVNDKLLSKQPPYQLGLTSAFKSIFLAKLSDVENSKDYLSSHTIVVKITKYYNEYSKLRVRTTGGWC